jgi:hypothetical protein
MSLTLLHNTALLLHATRRVARTLCVGNDDDLSCLVREMRSKRATALSKWVGEAWRGSQEDVYYEALMEVCMHAKHTTIYYLYISSYSYT